MVAGDQTTASVVESGEQDLHRQAALVCYAVTAEEYAMTDLGAILTQAHTIAVVGFSDDPAKAGHYVPEYLHEEGYRILPVNPQSSGAWGEPAYASLREIPEPVDIVLVFRRPEYCLAVVEDALAMPHRPRAIWLQSGITSAEGRLRAEDAGIVFVQDKCMMVEHGRYFH